MTNNKKLSGIPSMEEVYQAIEKATRGNYWPPEVTLDNNVVRVYTKETSTTFLLSRDGTTYYIHQIFDPIVTKDVTFRGSFNGSGLDANQVTEAYKKKLLALPPR